MSIPFLIIFKTFLLSYIITYVILFLHYYMEDIYMKNEIKAAINLKGKSLEGLAKHLNISKQALSNKFYRDSFSGSDLLKIAEYLECDLAFIAAKNKIILVG